MKPIDLFEAVKNVVDEKHGLTSYYIPVKVGRCNGTINPAELVHNLYGMGEVTDETYFGVSFNNGEEGYYPLSEIKLTGEAQLF